MEEITKKQFSFRGKSIDELKALDIREFAKYARAKERRYLLRNSNEVQAFVNRCREKLAKKKPIKTHSREIVIVPAMVGMRISVYNGKEFVQFDITNEMLAHRLGEFSLTRGKVKHGNAGVGATKGTKSKSKK